MQTTDLCAWPECPKQAVWLAIGRDEAGTPDRPGHKLGRYCEHHARTVVEEGNPEYTVECPCCKCLFGVN